MDVTSLRASLEALGPDLSRWPPDEAEAAIALLASSEEAQDLFAQATAEDAEAFGDALARGSGAKAEG